VLSAGTMLGHLAPPLEPAELWRAWSSDPLVWLLLIGAVVLHERGWRGSAAVPSRRRRWRRRAFLAAIGAAAVALVSPLDALSASLASAHMAQHLLLTGLVAPLLVLSAPIGPLVRGLPPVLGVEVRRLRRRPPVALTRVCAAGPPRGKHSVGRKHSGGGPRRLHMYEHPLALAGVHAATLWIWHAAGPYELALRNDLVHRVEHAAFLITAVAAWAAILASARRRGATGAALLALFGLSVQGSFLGALLAFASEPWYPSYGGRTTAWGLTALEDQQLAGVVMWVPGGLSYLLAALAATAWIAASAPAPSPLTARSS
jgi:cytochrome c oxidase assembly factor CtaG